MYLKIEPKVLFAMKIRRLDVWGRLWHSDVTADWERLNTSKKGKLFAKITKKIEISLQTELLSCLWNNASSNLYSHNLSSQTVYGSNEMSLRDIHNFNSKTTTSLIFLKLYKTKSPSLGSWQKIAIERKKKRRRDSTKSIFERSTRKETLHWFFDSHGLWWSVKGPRSWKYTKAYFVCLYKMNENYRRLAGSKSTRAHVRSR